MSRKQAALQRSRMVEERTMYEHMWLKRLQSVYLNRFEWKGLPDTIDPRFLERILMINGQAVFFELENNLMAMKAAIKGQPDNYDNWHEFTAYGANGWTYQTSTDEGAVFLYDSETRFNSYPHIVMYSNSLAEIDVIRRSNRRQQRNLAILVGNSEKISDLDQLIRDLETNEWVRIGVDGFSDSIQLEALQTGIPYLHADFHADQIAVLNDFYNLIGIEASNIEKKERLTSTESSIHIDATAITRSDALKPRRRAAEKVNEIYGTNITVDWNLEQFEDMVHRGALGEIYVEEAKEENKQEGETDGK